MGTIEESDHCGANNQEKYLTLQERVHRRCKRESVVRAKRAGGEMREEHHNQQYNKREPLLRLPVNQRTVPPIGAERDGKSTGRVCLCVCSAT